MSYRDLECPSCGRHRVMLDGVCEKCSWDADGDDYATITRPAPQCIVCMGQSNHDGTCPNAGWHGYLGMPSSHSDRIIKGIGLLAKSGK